MTEINSKKQRIYDLIPHREPFLFIDEIVEWTQEKIICAYTFKKDEFFFAGHYPGTPIVPGVLLCESAMQAGAIFTTNIFTEEEAGPDKVPVVGRINDVRFKQIIRPGQTVLHEITLREKMKGVCFLNAKTTCDDNLAVRFEFACKCTPKP